MHLRSLLTRALIGALLATTPLTGCDVVQSGKEGTLEFRLDTDDRLFPASFNTPLATGLAIDVLVAEAGSDGAAPVSPTLAQSRNQDVVRVTSVEGNRITLTGRAPGVAEIEVLAATGNDAFDIKVKDIAEVTLTYPGVLLVPETPPVRVVQGGVARFGVTLRDDQGRGLVGYGAFPVTISPAEAGTVRATTDVAHLSVAFTRPGAATLTPRGGTPLEVTVVPTSDVAGLTLEAFDDTVHVGSAALAVARGTTTDGDSVVGLSGLVAVTTSTPTACTVEETPKLGDAVFTVTGVGAGECRLAASFGELTAEATLSVTPRSEGTP